MRPGVGVRQILGAKDLGRGSETLAFEDPKHHRRSKTRHQGRAAEIFGHGEFLSPILAWHRGILSALHSLVASVKNAKAKLVWEESAVKSYEESKAKLFSPVLLAHPEPGAKLTLMTDASDIAMGAVLAQEDSRPLGFFFRKLSQAEKYSAFDKELLGIKEAIQHF